MKIWKLASVITALVLSTSINASVLNTLNGVNYEWLELTETAGLSRDVVELRLLDINDVLYGYEYASRQQVEDLLLSYATFDGVDGYHGAPDVVTGMSSYFSDFGSTYGRTTNGNSTTTSIDGFTVDWDSYVGVFGLYGGSYECDYNYPCLTSAQLYTNSAGDPTLASQSSYYGWSATAANPRKQYRGFPSPKYGSHLVKTSAVPVPAAVWLFGTGLIGLAGFARRKKA